VEIVDVRKPGDKRDLNLFSSRIADVTFTIIAVLGTDCAIGKRTTANIIASAQGDGGDGSQQSPPDPGV
jgi:uncharacterized NAD-dependent epimerase/dehydratase family protein